MKRMTLLLVVAVAPFSAHGQNLVSNPGFGADTVGWSGKTLVHNAADGYIGLGSAEVSEGGLDPDPIISQCVDITAYPDGTRYVFGAWLKAVNYDPSTGNTQPFARLRYSSTQACGNLSGEDGGAQGWPTHVMGSWQRYSAAGQPPPGTASVQLQVGMFQAPDAPVSITRIDDAFLEVATEPGGLVHLWHFNDNTQDVVGRVDGVIGGSPAYVAGVIGTALSFDGVDDKVTAAVDINHTAAGMNQMTMGAWVIPDLVTPVRTVISCDNGVYDRTLNLDWRGAGGTGWSAFTGTGVMGGGQAAHSGQHEFVAVVYDQATNHALLYVNGTIEGAATIMNTGLSSIAIAANPTYHEYFSGVIDEVFIFNRALSPEELDYMRGFGASIRFSDGFESGDTSRWSIAAP